MSDDTKQIIFILDDDKDIVQLQIEYLCAKIPDVDIKGFTNCFDMINHPDLKNVSLCIIDIELNLDKPGNEIAKEMYENKLDIPYLFMSGKNYNFECFEDYQFTFDFIQKPIDLNMFLTRVKVLLKVSKNYKLHSIEKTKLQVSLKELFDYTNIYLLILDCDMKIKMCSYKLGKDLGFKHEEEMIGLPWKQFLKEKDQTKIKTVFNNVVNDTEKYQKFLREVTNKIITKTGSTISVKWFNSRIRNGNIYTFSIGIPYNRKVTPADDIESIRSYWKHVLDKDETTLRALKEVV